MTQAATVCAVGITEKGMWHAHREYAAATGIATLAPHDLRRSWRDFVIRPESNRIQLSSCLATSRFKLRNPTSAANNESRLRSKIAWESSHRPEEPVCSAYELPTVRTQSLNAMRLIFSSVPSIECCRSRLRLDRTEENEEHGKSNCPEQQLLRSQRAAGCKR